VEREAEEEEEKKEEQETTKSKQDEWLCMDPEERKTRLLELFSLSSKQYISQNVRISAETTLQLHSKLCPPYPSRTIPAQIVQLFRQNSFSSFLMSVLCQLRCICTPIIEDATQPTCWNISKPIRKYIYGILLGGASPQDKSDERVCVTEYIRDGDTFGPIEVEASFILKGKRLPSLAAMMAMPPRTRLSIFLEILSSNTNLILSLPQEWIFPAAALRCFVVLYNLHTNNSNGGCSNGLHDWELLSLIANLINRPNYATLQKLRHENQLPITREKMYLLSSWQTTACICLCALHTVLNPLPTAPNPCTIYDGEALLYYLNKTQNKTLDYKKHVLRHQNDIELFDKLYLAIVEGEEEKIIKSKSVEETPKDALVDRKKEAALAAEKTATVTNAFSALREEKKVKTKKPKTQKLKKEEEKTNTENGEKEEIKADIKDEEKLEEKNENEEKLNGNNSANQETNKQESNKQESNKQESNKNQKGKNKKKR